VDQTQLPGNAEQAVPQMSDATGLPSDLSATPAAPEPVAVDPSEWESIQSRAARAEQVEREAAILRQQNRQYEQQMAQQAVAAWQQAERETLAAAKAHPDPDAGIAMTQDFYRRQQAALLGIVQQRDQQVHLANLSAWIDKNIQDHGLSAGDRARLAWVAQQDPNQVPAEAERIKAEREAPQSELQQLRQQVEQLTRATQANGIRQSGAWRTGGANPQPVATTITPGSEDHLRALLFGP